MRGDECGCAIPRQTVTHKFLIRASKAGDFTIPEISVTVDGIALSTDPLILKVLKRGDASATTDPWVFANGWRFLRHGKRRYYYDRLPAGTATLAAQRLKGRRVRST
jgi:hypothetical protein